MRSGPDFKSAQFDPVQGEAESSPVRIGGFDMTSRTTKSLLKVRWINFDPVQGLHELILIQSKDWTITLHQISSIII
jgi:hypothetical protein